MSSPVVGALTSPSQLPALLASASPPSPSHVRTVAREAAGPREILDAAGDLWSLLHRLREAPRTRELILAVQTDSTAATDLPWEQLETMRKASPLYDAGKIQTPTLIHVGENDPRCPPAHSRALHRAMHHYLKKAVELVVYPGAGHSLREWRHKKAKMEWDLAWFEKYVLGK